MIFLQIFSITFPQFSWKFQFQRPGELCEKSQELKEESRIFLFLYVARSCRNSYRFGKDLSHALGPVETFSLVCLHLSASCELFSSSLSHTLYTHIEFKDQTQKLLTFSSTSLKYSFFCHFSNFLSKSLELYFIGIIRRSLLSIYQIHGVWGIKTFNLLQVIVFCLRFFTWELIDWWFPN